MEQTKLRKINAINKTALKEIEYTITNAFHESIVCDFDAIIAASYVLLIAQENKLSELPELDIFLKTNVDDENIYYFIRNKLNHCWDKMDTLLNQLTTDYLLAYILFAIPSSQVHVYDTPSSITQLSLELLDIQASDEVADFGTGRGSFLVSACCKQPTAYYYGNEINTPEKAIAYIRSKLLSNRIRIEQGDMFSVINSNMKFDKVFSNYPFGMRLRDLRGGIEYIKQLDDNLPDITKATSSDWVFNSLLVSSIKKNGKAIGIMTNGSTWNSIDRPIREYFIRKGLVECVIALPQRMFEYTAISTVLMVFSNDNKKIRLVDAREMCQKGRRQNFFSKQDIEKIIFASQHDTENSKLVNLIEFKENEFVINPARYLLNDLTIENGVPFESIIKNITRGASITAAELDKIISDKPTMIQYLMLANIKDGVIDKELPYINEIAPKYEKYCLRNNCLLLSKNGYPFKVAVAQVEEGKKILGNGNLYIIELDQSKVNPYYLQAFFESEQGLISLKSITVGSTIPNIAIEQLKKLQIPLADLETQQKIANRYLAKLDEIAALKIKLSKAMNSLKNTFNEEV